MDGDEGGGGRGSCDHVVTLAIARNIYRCKSIKLVPGITGGGIVTSPAEAGGELFYKRSSGPPLLDTNIPQKNSEACSVGHGVLVYSSLFCRTVKPRLSRYSLS